MNEQMTKNKNVVLTQHTTFISSKSRIPINSSFLKEQYFGLKTSSCFRIFKELCWLWQNIVNQKKPSIYISTKKLENITKTSHATLFKAKQTLVDKGLIRITIVKEYKKGSTCNIFITNKGLALYHKILDEEKNPPKEKIQKEKHYIYNPDHEKVAKFWYGQARKYWLHQQTGTDGHLKNLGRWEETKDIRSDTIRKCCRLLKIKPDQLLEMMKVVITNNPEFYFCNVLGPDKWIGKKWKNGLYPIEGLANEYEQIQALDNNQQRKKEEKILIKDRDYIEGDMGEEENNRVRAIWDTMFESLGDKLQVYYSTAQAKEDAALSLSSLCDRLEYFTNPSFGGVDWWQNDNRNGEKYWKFILKEYKKTDIITPEMLWQKWLKFWQHNGVNLGYGHTLKDFYVPDYTKEV